MPSVRQVDQSLWLDLIVWWLKCNVRKWETARMSSISDILLWGRGLQHRGGRVAHKGLRQAQKWKFLIVLNVSHCLNWCTDYWTVVHESSAGPSIHHLYARPHFSLLFLSCFYFLASRVSIVSFPFSLIVKVAVKSLFSIHCEPQSNHCGGYIGTR